MRCGLYPPISLLMACKGRCNLCMNRESWIVYHEPSTTLIFMLFCTSGRSYLFFPSSDTTLNRSTYQSFSLCRLAEKSVGHHAWLTKKILGFRWCGKAKIALETIKFLVKYIYQYFQISSIFIYHESLPMKSYQFFKIYKPFSKKKEKNTHTAFNEKRKTLVFLL